MNSILTNERVSLNLSFFISAKLAKVSHRLTVTIKCDIIYAKYSTLMYWITEKKVIFLLESMTMSKYVKKEMFTYLNLKLTVL